MAEVTTQFGIKAVILTYLFAFHVIQPVISTASPTIPSDKSQLSGWFSATVNRAEADPKVIKVRKDGSGDFKTVTDAIKSIPSGNTQRTIVSIGAGDYNEKITIEATKQFVTLAGSGGSMPRIVYGGTAKQYGTVDSATVIVLADNFMAVNIAFVNSAPRPDGKMVGAQASAIRVSGDKAAFYKCKFIGFQDTLCDDRGMHFFKDCSIEGTVDFIFGSGKSLYLNTELRTVGSGDMAVIAAQAGKSEGEDTGFVFVHCSITGTGSTLLGRAWMDRPKVVFAYTNMGAVVKPEGWSNGLHPERDSTVFYGEYECTGPGASSTARVKYTKILTAADAKPFLTLDYIKAGSWLSPPPSV